MQFACFSKAKCVPGHLRHSTNLTAIHRPASDQERAGMSRRPYFTTASNILLPEEPDGILGIVQLTVLVSGSNEPPDCSALPGT